jgi:hypothetical protein
LDHTQDFDFAPHALWLAEYAEHDKVILAGFEYNIVRVGVCDPAILRPDGRLDVDPASIEHQVCWGHRGPTRIDGIVWWGRPKHLVDGFLTEFTDDLLGQTAGGIAGIAEPLAIGTAFDFPILDGEITDCFHHGFIEVVYVFHSNLLLLLDQRRFQFPAHIFFKSRHLPCTSEATRCRFNHGECRVLLEGYEHFSAKCPLY